MTYIKQLDTRKKLEDREKKKHQHVLDKLISREKKLISRRREADILSELRYFQFIPFEKEIRYTFLFLYTENQEKIRKYPTKKNCRHYLV